MIIINGSVALRSNSKTRQLFLITNAQGKNGGGVACECELEDTTWRLACMANYLIIKSMKTILEEINNNIN